MQNMPIAIFRGDDTDALGYQTIVGTIRTDLDLTGCKAVFKYLSFSVEFDPIPEDKKLTVIIPASETSKFPPGLGYASLRVYDSEGKLCTFSNRIMVFVATKTPMFGNEEFEVDFNVRPELEPLKIFVGPNPDDFDEYRGFLEKVIDRASAEKYGLAILLDAIDSDLGAEDGVAATPVAVKAAYAAIIKKLTDDYYTKDETDEAIDRVAAYYITYDAAGNPFPTYAALANATTVYSCGEVRVPTRNDYCVVLADETHDGAEYRYIYAVAEGQTTGSWQPQFPVEGVMTVDQSVTKDSQNPVSGGGVWSAIWGALTSLPGFSSIYDWCVATFRNKTDLNVYDDSSRVWTISNCTASGLGNSVNGRYIYNATEQKWLKDGITNFYIYRGSGQWVFVLLQGDHPVWTTDSAQGVSGTIMMTGGMTARYTIDVATSWETTDTLAKSSEIVTDYDGLANKPQINGNALTGNKTGAALGLLDSSNGVASGLVVAFGNYGIRWGSQSSTEYALELVTRPSASSSWQAIRTFYIPQASTGNLALMEQIVSKAIEAIAPEFSILYSYKVGQLVRKDGILYICTTAHPSGTQWNASHFSANATVESALAVIRAAIPTASTSTPQMDGTGSAGSSTAYARGDHRHPSDTTKLDKSGPNNRKIQWNAESGFLEVVDQNGLKFIFPSNSFGSAEFAASREYVDDKTPYKLTTKTIDNGAVSLDDRAMNAVAVSSSLASLTINFPTATSGKARDFGLRLTVASGITTAPQIVLPQGVTCENADGEAPEIGADGAATILYFTETASGVFLVKGETLTAITQA